MERFVRESFDIEDIKYCYYYWYTGLPARPAERNSEPAPMDLWAKSQRDGRTFASGIYFDCRRVLPKRNNTGKRGAGLSPGASSPLLAFRRYIFSNNG